ncbi:MAG TPA: DUF1573 domain-containing protein [Flavobacteriales bacterium]|nr:DUF1573 domain-containing protein [Flavobacteriales bacterium]
MHRLLLIIFLTIYSALAMGQAEFSFITTSKKFPKTKQGEVLKFDYEFTNTGDQPLVISEIKVACSCTKYEFPKEPIMPGQKSVIKLTFDTKSVYGLQDRTLDVYSNAKKNPFKLRFKVNVMEEKK